MKMGLKKDISITSELIIVVFLLILIPVQTLQSVMIESPIFDEPHSIIGGLTFWRTGKFTAANQLSLNSIYGVPLLFLDIDLPIHHKSYIETDYATFSQITLYHNNLPKVNSAIFLTRLVAVFSLIILAVFVYVWSRRLYGKWAGIFSLFLVAFEPTLLAYGHIATMDIIFTTTSFLAVFFLWNYLKNPSRLNLLAAALSFGIAQISKNTAIVLIPIYLFLILFCIYRDRSSAWRLLGSLVFIFIIGLLIINTSYLFDGTGVPLLKSAEQDWLFTHTEYSLDKIIETSTSSVPIMKKLVHFVIAKVPSPLPFPYVKSFVMKKFQISRGVKTYFSGETITKGKPYYYLVMFFTKLTVPHLVFFLIAIAALFIEKYKLNADELFIILPALAVFLFFSVVSKANIGFRHVMLVIPFLCLLSGRVLKYRLFQNIKVYGAPIFMILCAWVLLAMVNISPHYLSYYNFFVGDNGYKISPTVDLDYGQGTKQLFKYMEKNNISEFWYSHFGMDNPRMYQDLNITVNLLSSLGAFQWEEYGTFYPRGCYDFVSYNTAPEYVTMNLTDRCSPDNDAPIAIHVSMLYTDVFRPGCYDYFRSIEPTEKIAGNTIWIWKI